VDDDVPPPAVLRAFDCDGEPVRLAGGQGSSFRAGSVILKQASDTAEANWVAELFSGLEGSGFRVPRPVRSSPGGWVVDGWAASAFVHGEHAGTNGGRWRETIAACRAFHSALVGVPEPAFIRAADHAWAVADRLAWGELNIEPLQPYAEAIDRLSRLLKPLEGEPQVIHGDFTANVLFADGEAPCVIDFSPYWRPAAFAQAVVIGDALSWAQADPSIIDLCADVPEFPQYLVRAVLRRVYELDQHTRRGRPHMEVSLGEYVPTIGLLERVVAR
jgi:uncharacterized protein (TIGR02569 family)